ncbi:MAG TPA: GYF domain-containing protein [Gemmataceae bacterium]
MSDVLHVVRDGKWLGPFSTAQLRALAAAGRLRPTDSVWKAGMAQAVLVTKVKNLFPTSPPRPHPPDAVSAEVPPAPISPTPTVSPSSPGLSGVLAAGPPPTPPEEVPGTPKEHSPAAVAVPTVPPARPGTSTQPSEHKAGPNAGTPSRPKMRRAIAGNGAVLISQDGYNVHYRKKCSQCGFEDTCRSTMLISIGTTRSHFFCPKCRKNREVQIQGCMQ